MFAYNGNANSQPTPGLWIYKKSGDFRAKTSTIVLSGLFRVDWINRKQVGYGNKR